MVYLPQPQKSTEEIGERKLRNRTRDFQRVGASISGGQIDLLVVNHLKKKGKEDREKLLKEALAKELVLELPKRHTLAMKEDLGLSWFKLDKLRR